MMIVIILVMIMIMISLIIIRRVWEAGSNQSGASSRVLGVKLRDEPEIKMVKKHHQDHQHHPGNQRLTFQTVGEGMVWPPCSVSKSASPRSQPEQTKMKRKTIKTGENRKLGE